MSDGPPLPPPAIERPAAYEAFYGVVSGTVAHGTARLRVHLGPRLLVDRPLRGRRFSVRVSLPPRDVTLTVTAVRRDGRSSSRRVGPVFGLPAAARPRMVPAFEHRPLARDVLDLVRRYPGTAGVYVQSLTSGAGAAWNARAIFPGASTLKLAVAVAALARLDGPPAHGSWLDVLIRRMLILSDNDAANGVERAFGGSTSGGSALVNALMRSLGLGDTDMYGGYETERRVQGRIPVRLERQPSWGIGKRSSAWDLASLARALWLASAGKGQLRRAQPGLTPREARYLLYVLAHVRDPGKLGRFLGGRATVLHKAGWVDVARHDVGLVFWRGGVYVAAVLTHAPEGAGVASDVLAGRIARAALARFGG